MREWLYGRNPVNESLRANRRKYYGVKLAEGVQEKGCLVEILQICRDLKLPIEHLPRTRLEAIAAGNQGVLLEAGEYPYSSLDEILALAVRLGEPPLVLVLDVLQDPQNLGVLLRSAEAVGVHGVILPLRQTVRVTPAVVNTSAGACEHLLITQSNLALAIGRLKDAGLWVVGLEAGPEAQNLNQVRLDGPLALVVGNEGEGMRRLVRESCDHLVRLPMRGKIQSLNAAVAGSVVLYMVWQKRNFFEG